MGTQPRQENVAWQKIAFSDALHNAIKKFPILPNRQNLANVSSW